MFYIYIELASFLVALLYYSYLKDNYLKWMLPFLGFIFIMGCVERYSAVYRAQSGNLNIYVETITSIVEIVFYSYVFYQFNLHRFFKKLIHIFRIIFVFVYLFQLFPRNYRFFLPAFIVSSYLLTSIALFTIYFLTVDEEKITIMDEPCFWIALGISLFFSVTSIVFSMVFYIKENQLALFGVPLHNIIPQAMCMILYSCFIIAILLQKRKVEKVRLAEKHVKKFWL